MVTIDDFNSYKSVSEALKVKALTNKEVAGYLKYQKQSIRSLIVLCFVLGILAHIAAVGLIHFLGV